MRRQVLRHVPALWLVAAVGSLACGRAGTDAGRHRTPRTSPAPDVQSLLAWLGGDAEREDAAPDAIVDPEQRRLLGGPLAACIRRMSEGAPAELRNAIDTLEYPSLGEDACRLDLAVTMRAGFLCDGVALSAMREVCRTRAAIAVGSPDTCPTLRPDLGRDATCVALAARTPSLCAAADAAARIRCLAVAHGDVSECAALDPLLRPRCRADVQAMLTAQLPRMRGTVLPAGTFHLRVVLGARSSDGGGGVVHDYELSIASRGAFASADGTILLVDPRRGWPSMFAHSMVASDQPIVGFALGQPRRRGPGTVVDARIVLPDGTVVERASIGPPGTADFVHVAHERAGAVEGSFAFDTTIPGSPVHVEGAFRTFVRDVIAPDAIGRATP